MALTKNFAGLQNLMARHPIMAMVGVIGAQIAINGVQHSLPYTSENMVTKHLLAAGMCDIYLSLFCLINLFSRNFKFLQVYNFY